MAEKIFYSITFGFPLGILLRSFYEIGLYEVLFLIFLSVVVYIFLKYVEKTEFDSVFLVLIIFVISFGLGVWRMEVKVNHTDQLISFTDEEVILRGVVVSEPDNRESNSRFFFEVSHLNDIEVSSKILVVGDLFPEVQYGEELNVVGTLVLPENFEGETGREFDYISFLAKDDVYLISYYPEITSTAVIRGNVLKRNLFKIKSLFLETVNELIPSPHSSLLAGLVVGAKQALGSELLEDFRVTGIIHIVVLSGFNITIIALFIAHLFSRLPRRVGIISSIVAIVLFAILVGAGATVIRATIMAALVLIAKFSYREYSVHRALIIAGLLMLVFNPSILVFDPSFQLSFLATIALIYVAPIIERKLLFIPERFHFREIIVATIATQIFVLPFIMYLMGEISIVSLPVNLLILVIIPLTMLLGFFAGLIGLASTIIAIPFSYLAYALLTYILKVVEWFAAFPFASLKLSFFPFWLTLLIYFIYIFLILLLYRMDGKVDGRIQEA